MKKFLILLIILCSSTAYANDRKWTTIEKLPNNDSLKFFWVGAYKGYDSIYRIEVIRNEGLIKTIRVHGQPSFNSTKQYTAIKNCWFGGCRREIRLFELSNYEELQPIQMDKKAVFNLSWQNSILNIETKSTNNRGSVDTTSIPVENRNVFVRSSN